MAQQLYFIAIIPPDPIYTFALAQKEYFREKYNSEAALKSPPHITLHMPFRLKVKREESLIQQLRQLAKRHKIFELEVQGYGAFEPRVIYLTISKPEMLTSLQKELEKLMRKTMNIFNANYKDQFFHPHLTVAFRDLKKTTFYEAWREYESKDYYAQFKVVSFALLKHDGKQWQKCETLWLRNAEH
ncbi:MAG: 2'-5' RNA ligase family protein [Bacteroidota bacterium]